MNETDLIKMLSTPSAVVGAILWLHFRMKNLENRMELLAVHLGAPKPPKSSRGRSMLLLCVPVLLLLTLTLTLSGCVELNPNHREPTRDEQRLDKILNPPAPTIRK